MESILDFFMNRGGGGSRSVTGRVPPSGLTMDQIATSPEIGMSGDDLRSIRTMAETQVALKKAAELAAEAGIGKFIRVASPMKEAGKRLFEVAGSARDNALELLDPHEIEDAYNQMLSKRINDTLIMRSNGANIPQALQTYLPQR